jgi:transposase, IS5 family
MNQVTFASMAYLGKKKITRREKFLSEMERVIPWHRLERLIEPAYPDIGNGRQPMGLSRMLRIYLMQQWFQLSDPGMEDALYDSESMRRFAQIELGLDAIPDETTILNFRHLLEEHDLTAELFSEVQAYLEGHGLMLREGTIVDATIIDAPSSTKNKDKKRDPEMTSTKKGNQWYFGMKAHAGVDADSGLVHTVVCTTASVHDSQVMEDLLHGDEDKLYGDKAYADNEKKEQFEAAGGLWRVSRKATPARALSDTDKKWNRRMSRVRSKGEHPFRIVKDLWRYAKVRYRGILKNACQLFTLFALANIYAVRRKLLKLQA